MPTAVLNFAIQAQELMQSLQLFYQDVKNLILEALFPLSCLACEAPEVLLCNACAFNLKPLESQRCLACGHSSLYGFTHPKCFSPYLPEAAISLWDYHDEKVSELLISGKYRFLPKVFEVLAQTACGQIVFEQKQQLAGFSVAAVPLAKARLRWRGFNQAQIIARVLAQNLGLPLAEVLRRKRATQVQKDLSKEARKTNVLGAFELVPNSAVGGKNFLLVDDVATTGATLLEAAKVLKRNGAGLVWCFTLARD